MLQPSPETLSDPTPPAGGDLAVVEAPTAALALREVQRQHGVGARIVHAEKVLRGGLGGFFQRELVQLTVDVDGSVVSASSAPVRAEDVHDPTVGQRFLSAVREAMARDEDAGTARPQETFGELLDRAVGSQRPDGTLVTDTAAGTGAVVVRRSPSLDAPAPDPATASPMQPAVPAPDSPWRPAPRPAPGRPTPPGLADERRRRSADEVVGGLDAVIARLTADETSREADDGDDLRARVELASRPHPTPGTAGDWRARAVAGAPPDWVERLPRAEADSLRPVEPEPVRPLATLADVTTRAWHADVDEIDLGAPAPEPVTFDERLAAIAALREADIAAGRAAAAEAAAAERAAGDAAAAVAPAAAPVAPASTPQDTGPGAPAVTAPEAAAAPFRAELPPGPGRGSPVGRAATDAAAVPQRASSTTSLLPERQRSRRDEPSPVRHRTAGPSRGSTRPLALDEAAACRRMQVRLAHATTASREPVGAVGPWSLAGLRRLGMPSLVVDAVRVAAPVDDLGWFTAVARAVADVCGELPAGAGTVVGPLAGGLDPAAAAGTVEESGELLAALPAGAWLEVVVGGSGWRDWLWDERTGALSVAADDTLPEALCAALDLALPLAHAVRGDRVARVSAVDVAATVRALLEARA